MIYHDFTGTIGSTPLIRLSHVMDKYGLHAELLAKVEFFNPAGSTKDRAAFNMILNAEKKGLLKKDSVIIEPTSGNTGIGLAAIAAVRGYRVILTMPETMSLERRKLLAAYGAELILTDGDLGMAGAIAKAQELADEIPSSYIPSQFENPANAEAHYLTTGPEIWQDCNGHIDYFVAGIGTGGTITGVGKYLREHNPNVKLVGIEPADSPVITEGHAGSHGIQGIGANFVPSILDLSLLDEVICVQLNNAIEIGQMLPKTEGLLVGISSGAALWAAIELAKRAENSGKKIVVLLPDTGERYLSSLLFE